MSEFLTMAEIEARYAPDWVLMVDLDMDEERTVLRGGRVIFHSPDGDAVSDKLLELRPKRFAVWCFAPPPEHLAINL